MSGDTINIRASACYRLNVSTPNNQPNFINDLVQNLANGVTRVQQKYGYEALHDVLLPAGAADISAAAGTGRPSVSGCRHDRLSPVREIGT